MSKTHRTFSFYGNDELGEMLEEFQHKNKIVSKSKAIKLLLDTGLRNWSPPEEADRYEQWDQDNTEAEKKDISSVFYELINGKK